MVTVHICMAFLLRLLQFIFIFQENSPTECHLWGISRFVNFLRSISSKLQDTSLQISCWDDLGWECFLLKRHFLWLCGWNHNHHRRRCCPQRKIIIIHSLWLALREETRRELQIDTFCPIYFDYHDFVVMIMMVMWMIMVLVISLCRRRWKQIVEEYIRSPHAESMRKRNWWELKYKQIVRYANTHAASSLLCFHWYPFEIWLARGLWVFSSAT